MLVGLAAALKVDLREGAEALHAGKLDLEATLVVRQDLALNGDALVLGLFEHLERLDVLAERGGELDAAAGVDDEGLDLVADLHGDVAFVIYELGGIDGALGLGAEADEDGAARDGDDAGLHPVAVAEVGDGGVGGAEHGGEVVGCRNLLVGRRGVATGLVRGSSLGRARSGRRSGGGSRGRDLSGSDDGGSGLGRALGRGLDRFVRTCGNLGLVCPASNLHARLVLFHFDLP